MDLANDELKRFRRATISIEGNALAYGNKIYNINNIVKLEFDSLRERKGNFSSLSSSFKLFKKSFSRFIKGVILSVLLIFLFDFLSKSSDLNLLGEGFINAIGEQLNLPEFVILIVFVVTTSFLASSLAYLTISCFSYIYYLLNKYQFVYGLHLQLVTGERILFVSRYNYQFITKTIDGLHRILAGEGTGKLTINFNSQEAYFANKIDKSSISVRDSSDTNLINNSTNTNVANGGNYGNMNNEVFKWMK